MHRLVPLLILVAAALAVAIPPAGAAEAAPETVVLTVHLVTVRTDECTPLRLTPDSSPLSGHNDPARGVSVAPVREVLVGSHRLGIDGHDVVWDGSPELPPEGPAEHLSSPSVFLRAGQTGTVSTDHGPVEYLEPAADGSFRLQRTSREESPRMQLSLTAVPVGESTYEVDVDLDLTVMSGREPVEGTSLDLGRPTFISRQLETRIQARPGEWQLLAALLTQPRESTAPRHLLVFFQLDRPPAKAGR